MSAALASELRRLARLAQALVTGPPLGGVWPEMIVGDEPRLDAPAASDADPADAQRARTRWAARLGEVVHLKDAAYLPPELLDAEAPIDARADVYSVAAMAYRAATGHPPAAALDGGAALTRLLSVGPARVILAALGVSPAARPTMFDLASALEAAARAATAHGDDARAQSEPGPRRARPAHATPTSSTSAREARGATGTAAAAQEAGSEPARRRTMLQPLLLVGVSSVFVGALWFIWLSWGRVSDVTRLLLGVAFTAAVAGAGRLLSRLRFTDAANAFVVLATQLLWAVGGLALLTAGAIDRGVGWALVGAVVAGVSATVALRRGPRMILLSLAAIAVLAAAVALYGDLHGLGRVVFFVGVSAAMRALVALGERLGLAARAQLFAVVHVLSLLAAALLATHEMHLGAMGTALVFGGAWVWARAFAHTRRSRALAVVAHLVGVPAVLSLLALKHDGSDVWLAALLPAMAVFEAALARRRGDAASEEVAIVVAGCALWVLGYFVAAEVDATNRVSPFDLFVVGTVTWALTVALALWRRRPIVSGASPVHLGAAALFLGEHLSSGTYYGRSIYFAGVAITFALLALTVFRGRQWLQASHVVGALVAAAVSSACSLALIPGSAWDTSQLFGAAFAYAPSLGLIALRFDRATASRTAGSVGIAVLALLPSVELLLRPSSRALGAVAAVTGFALLAVALYVRSEDDVERLSPIRTPSAHSHLLRIATIAALLPAVVAAFYVAGRPLAAVLPFVVLVVLPAAAAFGLGLAAEPTRSRAARALQLAAATVFLGAFSLFSAAASRDYGHPALLLVGGAALLFFATMRRHRPIVLMSTAALVLGFWTQFFAKLHDKAPLSVLLIIFGVSLLAIGVLYETRLKRIVDNVRSWPGV